MSETKTQASCEEAGGTWDAEKGTCTMPEKPTGDADLIRQLMRENEMLKAEVKVRTDQVKQATNIAIKANQLQEARDAAERASLIEKITIDSNHKWNAENLKDKNIKELQFINTVVQTSLDHTFANIAAMDAETARKTKPQLTAGFYAGKDASGNPIYKGGL